MPLLQHSAAAGQNLDFRFDQLWGPANRCLMIDQIVLKMPYLTCKNCRHPHLFGGKTIIPTYPNLLLRKREKLQLCWFWPIPRPWPTIAISPRASSRLVFVAPVGRPGNSMNSIAEVASVGQSADSFCEKSYEMVGKSSIWIHLVGFSMILVGNFWNRSN